MIENMEFSVHSVGATTYRPPETLVNPTGDQWSPLQNESAFQVNESQKIIIKSASI